jgi:hypothetical protein
VAPQPKGSSPHSQDLANYPYPLPGESTPPPQPISPRSILIPSSLLRPGLSSGLFPSGFPTQTLYKFLPSITRATCLAHLILLDLIRLIVSGHDYTHQRELVTIYLKFISNIVTEHYMKSRRHLISMQSKLDQELSLFSFCQVLLKQLKYLSSSRTIRYKITSREL